MRAPPSSTASTMLNCGTQPAARSPVDHPRAWYHTWSYGRATLSTLERVAPIPLQTAHDYQRRRVNDGSLRRSSRYANYATASLPSAARTSHQRRQLPPLPRQRAARMGCTHQPPCYAVATGYSALTDSNQRYEYLNKAVTRASSVRVCE